MSTKQWIVEDQASVVPLETEPMELALSDSQTMPEARSSGWLCTLTIECGTRICACR